MSTSFQYDQDFEENGEWWIPGSDTRVPGRLQFSPNEGLTLHLHSVFPGYKPQGSYEEVALIHGVCAGRPCTLLSNALSHVSIQGHATYKNARYSPLQLLVGVHADGSAPLLKSLSARFSGLEEWAGARMEHSVPDLSDAAPKVEVWPAMPARTQVDLEDGLTLRLRPDWSMGGDTFAAFRMAVSVEWVLASSSPKPLTWFLGKWRSLHNLMVLLMGAPIRPLRTLCELHPSTERRRTPLLQSFVQGALDRKRVHARTMPAPLNVLGDRFAVVARAFFAQEASLQAPYAALFSGCFQEKIVEEEFLTLSQGLEILHRRTRNATIVDDDTFRAACKQLKSAIKALPSPRLRDRFYESINFANELTFRMRLQSLLDDAPEEYRHVLCYRQEDFVHRVKQTRNYLVHGGKEPPELFSTGEMIYANRSLEALLWYSILRALGLEAADAALAVSRSERHMHLYTARWENARRGDEGH